MDGEGESMVDRWMGYRESMVDRWMGYRESMVDGWIDKICKHKYSRS